jgi:hypothetical protein
MKRIYASLLAVLVFAAAILLSAGSAASAGGIECSAGMSEFDYVNYSGLRLNGSGTAFSFEANETTLTWKVQPGYHVTAVAVGTEHKTWGTNGASLMHGEYRYVSSRRFTQITFCVSPGPLKGAVSQMTVVGSASTAYKAGHHLDRGAATVLIAGFVAAAVLAGLGYWRIRRD